MRAVAALSAFLFCVPTAGVAASGEPTHTTGQRSASQCQQTTSYLAGKSGFYRGPELAPRKLNELPRASAYMAVYRRIDGCDAPLTMVDHWNPRRR
jgi:hypothetical protein